MSLWLILNVNILKERLRRRLGAGFAKLNRFQRILHGAFLDLIQTPGTLARIEHMLETGKPLRN